MKNQRFIIISLLIIALLALIIIILNRYLSNPNQGVNPPDQSSVSPNQPSDSKNNDASTTPTPSAAGQSMFTEPISSALKRITKKPFGIYITPQNSPVSPEKFTGYHTGVDFEILPGEENIDVPIYAICNGTLALKKYASGYGGVAVQSCQLNNQAITVIYGHLKLASINLKTGAKIMAGDKIGILGKGYSTETDGERKHLHLGIHKGASINLLGYVQNASELINWIDVMKYLK